MIEDLKIIAAAIAYPFLPTYAKALVAANAKRQEEIISLCALVGYPYKEVEAAVNASGSSPNDLYGKISAIQYTEDVERFYEALKGPR